MKPISVISIISATLLFVSCSGLHLDGRPYTYEEAVEKTRSIWNQYDLVKAYVDPVPAGTVFNIPISSDGTQYETTPDYDAWLIFADTDIHSNGGRHFKWIFVNKKTGKVEQLDTFCEPIMDYDWSIEEYNAHISLVKMSDYYKSMFLKTKSSAENSPDIVPRNSSSSDWAVIISGGVNKENNHVRYWNDCSWIYKVLRQCYGFSKDHIFPLISDGTDPAQDRNLGNTYDSSPTDLDGDGVADVQYSATLSNLSSVFSTLSSNVQSGDNVLVYVIDHGSRTNSTSYICLWNGQTLSPTALASMVSSIDSGAHIHFVLGQCFSGGFISALSGSNRTVVTACKENESSYSLYGSNTYDEFVYHWTNAIAGQTPDGDVISADSNGDGFISIHEAYTYAKNTDYYYTHDFEHPQYNSSPSLFGAHYDLIGNYSYIPTISGPKDLSSSGYSTYSISDTPPGSTVSWSLQVGAATSPLGSGLTKSLSNIYSSLPYVASTLTASVSSSIIYTDSQTVRLWVPGIHFNSGLIQDSSPEFLLWQNPHGATGFIWATDDPNVEIQFQGYYFTEYRTISGESPAYTQVWVTFENALGESTTIVRME